MLGFLVATIAFGGVWLALAMLFSVLFRAPATAALAALGLWLLFALFWTVMVTPLLATVIAGPAEGIFGPNIAYISTEQTLQRLSPNTLYSDAAVALLNPTTRALGPVFVSMRELSTSVLLASSQNQVLATLIFDLKDGGNIPHLAALGVLLILTLVVLVLLANKLGARFGVQER